MKLDTVLYFRVIPNDYGTMDLDKNCDTQLTSSLTFVHGYDWLINLPTLGNSNKERIITEPPHDKTNKMMCAQRRLRPASASAQSDQSLQEQLDLALHYLSHVMKKPVFAICEQQRCRSAWASAQSDQRLCYSLPRHIV